MKIPLWRNMRDGKIGIAMNCGLSANNESVYEDNDNSATSNSWYRNIRKNVSSTTSGRYVARFRRMHATFPQGARAIVVPASHRQTELRSLR